MLQEKWVVAAKRADFNKIGQQFSIDPLIARLIRNRDVEGEEAIRQYLNGTLEDLHSPDSMKDMQKGAELILLHIRKGERIRIIGDYDIDGIMSSYILKKGLGRLGARCDVRIPDRIRDGYGLNENLVKEASEDGAKLIVTCDNGIAAFDQIMLAKDLGLTVVITDHHEVPYEEGDNGGKNYRIPPADAVINPKQADCRYPFKGICGAVVAWKLICYLYDLMNISDQEKFDFLEFAAFATIGDVMELKNENRIIVKEGLKRLRKTENLGMQQLILANNLDPDKISTYHVGFVLGPCMNASGRLNTAQRALDLLCEEQLEEAARLAGDLKALNDSRKEMTEKGQKEAIELVESTSLSQDRVLVVYLPDCHESLAGIIAGRLKEHFGKPSFVLTKTENGVKGSGRSIEAYSMYEEMTRCGELLTKYGGHPMAAGLSLEEKNVPVFRKRLNELCTLTGADLKKKVTIDAAMPISYIRRELVEQMELLEPFGTGNPRPVFAEKNLRVSGIRVMGASRNAARLQVQNEFGARMQAIYFGDADGFAEFCRTHETVTLLYYPAINRYMGRETLQINITGYR
ncbi:MAG: single-stranded-DNA-specific exonuclease RecJ [Lachnospiraceae bacterium]|nr:single-stranded-DNA-specific exonuclease RecJ [Lachnospiraceae bacterium]